MGNVSNVDNLSNLNKVIIDEDMGKIYYTMDNNAVHIHRIVLDRVLAKTLEELEDLLTSYFVNGLKIKKPLTFGEQFPQTSVLVGEKVYKKEKVEYIDEDTGVKVTEYRLNDEVIIIEDGYYTSCETSWEHTVGLVDKFVNCRDVIQHYFNETIVEDPMYNDLPRKRHHSRLPFLDSLSSPLACMN